MRSLLVALGSDTDRPLVAANRSARTFGWRFKGQAAIEAAVKSLVRDHGLGSAPGHTLLFAGGSAGGRGAMVNLDYLPAVLASLGAGSVRLLGYLDSNYWIDDGCGMDSQGMVGGQVPSRDTVTVWPDGCRMNIPTRTDGTFPHRADGQHFVSTCSALVVH